MLHKADDLLDRQLRDWKQARDNYFGLLEVQERELKTNYCKCRLQFNPKRIVSTGAKTDKVNIARRACFLCEENRPTEQDYINYNNKYQILVNPYPILPVHFTIASTEHRQQSIADFGDMLDLAEDLQDYSIIYNAPDCGASAPDHMHFQAGTKGFTQTEREVELIKSNGRKIREYDNTCVFEALKYLRSCFLIISDDKEAISKEFDNVVRDSCLISEQFAGEPMLNIICRRDEGVFTVFIFPRKAHRSSHYHDKENPIMISPGTIDIAGVLITPRIEDFVNTDIKILTEIFEEVSYITPSLQ